MKCPSPRVAVLVLLTAAAAPAPTLSGQDEPPFAFELPDPKHRQHSTLRALAGTWEFTMKMEAMPGVPGMEQPTESKGTETAELNCNGLWPKSVVNATYQGKPYQGIWLAGYDPFQRTYVNVWVSSASQECGPSTMKGAYDDRTKTWSWNGVTSHGEMRSSYTFEDPDRAVETCYMKGPDGAETKYMEITRTRSKVPAVVNVSSTLKENLGKEHLLMLEDVGDWQATVKTMAPGQAPIEEQATERVIGLCNGLWLWSDFNGQFMGAPFMGHGLVGFDPIAKHYVSFWIDSISPV
jgi:hypothetical protein